MARLYSSGFELNSLTAGVEITGAAAGGDIDTTIVKSGTYSYFVNSGERLTYQFASSNQTAPFYFRYYIKISSLPTNFSANIIFVKTSIQGEKIKIILTTAGVLQLFNDEDETQIGSDSSALSLNTWYRIELKVDTTTIASTSVDARIDGTSFASGTANLTAGIGYAEFGNSVGGITGLGIYFEDIAINDSTGSFQNSWPGAGSIVHLKPNAAGDNSAWTNDFANVLENTPDDGTTFTSSNTLDQIDDHNLIATDAFLYQGEGTTGVGFGEFASTRYRGMTFRALSTSIDAIAFQLNALGTKGIRIYLYAADGSDIPTGAELTHWDITNASLSTAFTKYSFTAYTSLTVGSLYAIYYAPWDVGGTDAYVDDYRDMVWKTSNVYGGGKPIVNNSGTWSISDSGNLDQKFVLFYTDWSITSSSTINVVQVGVRFNGAGASANASFVLRIKASASGTVEESSAITPASATYITNAAASPQNYSLTLYDLPGASATAWTKTDLDAAQIGYRLSATSTNAAQVSTVWLLVDYATAAVTPAAAFISRLMMMGLGR